MYHALTGSTSLTDDEYMLAIDVDDQVIWPLSRASNNVYDALSYVEEMEVDNTDQREYIKTQVADMISKLKEIEDKLEG